MFGRKLAMIDGHLKWKKEEAMAEGNSLRDVMKDMIRGYLADYNHIAESEVDCDMVADLADVVFDVMKIPEDKQDYPYKEYETIIGMSLERGEW